MQINMFKPGDVITRTEPRYFVDELGGTGSHVDGSFIGMRLIFRGIANGCIIVEMDNPIYDVQFRLQSLPLYTWQDGWEYWIDPQTVGRKKARRKRENVLNSNVLTKQDYEKELEKLVEHQRFEDAAKLRDEMKKRFG